MSILNPENAPSTLGPSAQPMSYAPPQIGSAKRDNNGGSSEKLPTGWLGVPLRAWWMATLLTITFSALYWTSLIRLWRKTNPISGTSEWAHAIFVPIVGLYYLFLNLDDLVRAPVKPLLGTDLHRNRFIAAAAAIAGGAILWKVVPLLPGPFANYGTEIGSLGFGIIFIGVCAAVFDWGLGTLIAGLATYAYGVYPGRNDFVKDVGMVMSIFGMVLTIGGWGIMRIAWFPCVFLLFALPWPGLFYSKLAGPMQTLAAQVAVGVMQILGVETENAGTQIIIHKPNVPMPRVLNVAEACAGLRSLMTFVSLGAAVAFLSSRPLWQKLVITFSAVPIAIFCNVMRVTGQGMLDYYVDENWSSGFAHQFAGIVLLLPGFMILLLIVWLLDKLFVDEDDTAIAAKPAAAATATTPKKVGGVA